MARPAPRLSRRSLLKAAGLTGAGSLAGVPLLTACGEGSRSGDASGRLTLGTTQIMQFDPYQTNTALHIHTFYAYLLDYTDDYTATPAAASKWEFAGDKKSVTVTLRKSEFQSGQAVTAADVVAGVERAKDPEAGFTLAATTAFIDRATAEDDRTVRLDFAEAVPDELVLDWMFAFPLVPAKRNDVAALEKEPAGSGPFLMEDFRRDRLLRLKKNPDFWKSGEPRLDEVEFRFFRDEESLVSALESGDLDGALYLSLRNADRLRDRYELVQGAGRMDLFFMNGARPPFADKKVRQALARAIDRERIIDQVRFGLGKPVYTAFMPESPAFDAGYLDSHGFDLDAARKMLDAAGGPRKATAAFGPEPGAKDIVQAIQADFEKIGFELTLKPMEETAFLDALFAGELDCCIAAQPNNLQSPSLISRGRQMLPTEDNVMMGDRVPARYAAAVEASRTALTPDAQATAYAELNEVLVDEAWAVGIATRPSLAALERNVSGYAVDKRDFLDLTRTRTA